MRYVVIDLSGNQRATFESRAELIDELREGADDDPEALSGIYVTACDDEGRETMAPVRADAMLAGAISPGQSWTLLFDFVHQRVRAVVSPESDGSFQEVRKQAAALAGLTGVPAS
jgi:hypothetical protein